MVYSDYASLDLTYRVQIQTSDPPALHRDMLTLSGLGTHEYFLVDSLSNA